MICTDGCDDGRGRDMQVKGDLRSQQVRTGRHEQKGKEEMWGSWSRQTKEKTKKTACEISN